MSKDKAKDSPKCEKADDRESETIEGRSQYGLPHESYADSQR